WQEPSLNLRSRFELTLGVRFLVHLAIQARVLDRERGVRRQRADCGERRRRVHASALLAVEVEDADRPLDGLLRRTLDEVHRTERHAQDVANAETARALVVVHLLQIFDDAWLAGDEDAARKLLAGLEIPSGRRHFAARSRELELQRAARIREHDEAAFGAGHVDRRIEYERENFVHDALRSQRAQAKWHSSP